MKIVQPIRDLEKIEEMKQELLKVSYKAYMLFVVGINIGLRVSDILKLRVYDVKNKTHITVVEEKTGKTQRLVINNTLKDEFDKYIKNMKDDEYLFKSRKGNKPISRVQAYRILNACAKKIGLAEVGTHTLRKSFGYHFYLKTKDAVMLQKIFKHSSQSVTLRYIGIEQTEIDKALMDFSL